MSGRSAKDRRRPLAPAVRLVAPVLPVVAALGLLASILEGAGIGLFIPLLALLISGSMPEGLPGPLQELSGIFAGHDAQGRVVLIAAAILGLIFARAIVQAANEALVARTEGRIGREIRNGLADRLLALNYPFFLRNDPVRLTRILSTDSWFVLEAARSMLSLIPAAAGLLVFSALLALLNPRLFAIVVVGAAVVQLVLYLSERRQQRLSRRFTISHHRFWERLVTLVRAPRLIRLFGQQDREQKSITTATEQLRQSIVAGRYQAAIVNAFADAMIALLFLAVLLAGYRTGMSIPEITAFALLLTRAQPHAKTIARSRLDIASFHGSVGEVEWLLGQETPGRFQPAHAGEVALDRPISFERVAYTYPNGGVGLHGATLTIAPGVATALIGPSGSGKTTIVNLLCRLIEPQSGSMRLGDQPVAPINLESWRARIAVAGQDSELVTGTVAENICYGRPDAAITEIEDAAGAAGATEFIAALPQGYQTLVGPDGLSLSGGQRQRIGLARALLRRPDLLILDEATNAVDALSEAEMMTLIAEHKYFRTLLVISHRKATLSACQLGIVLEDGSVVESGPLPGLRYFQSMAGPHG